VRFPRVRHAPKRRFDFPHLPDVRGVAVARAAVARAHAVALGWESEAREGRERGEGEGERESQGKGEREREIGKGRDRERGKGRERGKVSQPSQCQKNAASQKKTEGNKIRVSLKSDEPICDVETGSRESRMTDASGVRSPTGSCVDYGRVFAPVTPASGLRASQDAFHTTRVTIEHARETRDGRACCSTRAESP
jgi:hypothetical protein